MPDALLGVRTWLRVLRTELPAFLTAVNIHMPPGTLCLCDDSSAGLWSAPIHLPVLLLRHVGCRP